MSHHENAIPSTPIFPHRCIFDSAEQYKLYSSNWFQNVLGLVFFINEEIKGRTLADVKSVSPVCQRLHNLFVALEELVSRVPPIAQRSRFGNLSYRTWLDRAREIIVPFMEELLENSGTFPPGFASEHRSQFVQDQLDKYPTIYLPTSTPSAPLFVNGKPINTAPPAPATHSDPVMGAAIGGVFPLPRAQPDPALSQQREGHACSLAQEMAGILIESFGSYKRVDYGSGHELTFVSFLAAMLQIGVLKFTDLLPAALVVFARYVTIHSTSKDIKLPQIILYLPLLYHISSPITPYYHLSIAHLLIHRLSPHSYLRLVRVLQRVYWLEPAGSKGVWGLDDYQFLPFLWGAAQLVGADAVSAEQADANSTYSCVASSSNCLIFSV